MEEKVSGVLFTAQLAYISIHHQVHNIKTFFS